MQEKEQTQRTYDDAVQIVKSRKNEVTLDAISVEAKLTVDILGKVLQVDK